MTTPFAFMPGFLGTAEKKGMDPVLSSSIITAITSLLSGGMGGLAMGQERRYRAKQAEKIKPKMPFYQTPYLAGFDKVLMQAILANLEEQREGKFDFGNIIESMGQLGQGQVTPRSKRLIQPRYEYGG